MGHGASAELQSVSPVFHKKAIKEVVALMMPLFYTEDNVSEEDLKLAGAAWELILDDQSPVFIEKKLSGSVAPSCMMFFYDTFYKRLFDVHPVS